MLNRSGLSIPLTFSCLYTEKMFVFAFSCSLYGTFLCEASHLLLLGHTFRLIDLCMTTFAEQLDEGNVGEEADAPAGLDPGLLQSPPLCPGQPGGYVQTVG